MPAHLLTSASQNGCVTGHRLVLTERIRDPTLVMMTFSATSATMMFKSEGVMHTLVSAAQKHASLPAWGRTQEAAATASSRIGNDKRLLQQQRWCRLGLFNFFRPPGRWVVLGSATGGERYVGRSGGGATAYPSPVRGMYRAREKQRDLENSPFCCCFCVASVY